MSRTGRNALLLLITGVLIAGLSVTVMAAEEGSEEDGATDMTSTTVASEEGGEEGGAADSTTSTTIASGLSPAVTVAEDDAAAADVDWTYRYMIPTGLALAVIIILVTAIKYFTDVVRKRYRIVE